MRVGAFGVGAQIDLGVDEVDLMDARTVCVTCAPAAISGVKKLLAEQGLTARTVDVVREAQVRVLVCWCKRARGGGAHVLARAESVPVAGPAER